MEMIVEVRCHYCCSCRTVGYSYCRYRYFQAYGHIRSMILIGWRRISNTLLKNAASTSAEDTLACYNVVMQDILYILLSYLESLVQH